MAYTINYTDSAKGSITVEDGTIDQTTSLDLPGRNTTSYGTVIGSNFIRLLENFASSSSPLRPTEGQLWYDTTEGVNTLKIYDGTNWVTAGGIKKGATEPDVASALPGDLWSDIDNNQLYFFTGSGWILVGPEFSDGLLTGSKPEVITGTDEVDYTVLQIEVSGNPMVIYSSRAFVPKSTINGFPSIKVGFNLSQADLAGDGVGKIWGTAENAENLVVSGESITAGNFLRSDVASSTDFPITVRSNSGIQVGQDGLLSVGVEGSSAIINNLTSGSSIDMRVNNLGATKTVLRVDSTEKVGINNLSPAQALDVTGSIQSSGRVIINDTSQSTTISTGALRVSGGVGIALDVNTGGAIKAGGNITGNNVLPSQNATYNIGSDTLKWSNVYATNFIGNLVGNITGTVSGRSGSTNKLAQATTFQLSGDVSSNLISFDGQTGGTTKVFTTAISNTFIANQNPTPESRVDDEFILNRVSGTPGVYKISQRNFLAAVPTTPIGVVTPFAGGSAPAGWLLCDGTEYRIADFLDLFQVIQYRFKDQSLVQSGNFAVPDLRGRFALGADNMGGTSANRVSNISADTVGNSGGTENKNINIQNLPEHEHDLRGPSGDQYYVIRDIAGVPNDPQGIQYDAPTGTQAGQAYPTSGGVLTTTETLGTPLDVMNPFTTMNYIIYTGQG